MNDNHAQQHADCEADAHASVPLGRITSSQTTRVADRVTGNGKRPTTFDSAL